MGPIEERVAKQEGAQNEHGLKIMSDNELMAYGKTFSPGSNERIDVVLARALRHRPTGLAVRDDPEHEMPYGKEKP